MSSTKHPLESLLQNHLGTDSAALTHVYEITLVLRKPGVFNSASSGLLGKWNARINSLLHSREPSSRWIGLVLAKCTASSSRNLLVENTQGWVGVVLPMLSKPEPFPNYHAAIRLLACLFTSVTDMPEFSRQIIIPNIQKCSLALLSLAKSDKSSLKLKRLAVDTLAQFVSNHPTHHRAIQQQLHAFTLDHLQGSFPVASSQCLLDEHLSMPLLASVITLHATLPVIGGKVGAGAAWRKSVDSAVGTIWSTLKVLRRTYGDFLDSPAVSVPFAFPPLSEDPAIATPLGLDRLRCMVRLLVKLLETPSTRPVSMPLGSLSYLALKLMQLTDAEPTHAVQTPFEPVQRTVEAAAVPELCVAGCMLAQSLARGCGKHFTPYAPRFLNAITYQLDRPNLSETHLINTIPTLLSRTHPPAPSQSCTRLASNLVKILGPLLPSCSVASEQVEKAGENKGKGKKRARYEADELFTSSSSTPTSTEQCTAVLSALSSLIPTLPLSTQSAIHRTLLVMLLHLPRSHPTDLSLAEHLASIYAAGLSEGASASGTLGVSVKAVHAASLPSSSCPGSGIRIFHRLIHPRVPPFAGSSPSIDNLALFWKDEEDEEARDFRIKAGIVTAREASANKGGPLEQNDAQMTDASFTTEPSSTTLGEQPVPRTALPEFTPPTLPSSVSTSVLLPTSTPAAPVLFGNSSTSSFSPRSAILSAPELDSGASKTMGSSRYSTEIAGTSNIEATQSTPPLASTSIRSPLPAYEDDDDDDEPIPQIDLGSDTDEDEV